MNILSALLVALGLSMDNLAVTIVSGCSHQNKIPLSYIGKVSALFAVAHFMMFSVGWLGGAGFDRYIGAVDHWIAFGILAFIGVRMVKEAQNPQVEKEAGVLHSFIACFVGGNEFGCAFGGHWTRVYRGAFLGNGGYTGVVCVCYQLGGVLFGSVFGVQVWQGDGSPWRACVNFNWP